MTKHPNPFIIGLTGGIGSGKTAVSDWFASQGIDIVDADVISHAITAKNSKTLAHLAKVFADEYHIQILTTTGELDRALMRQFVFSHPNALQKLNAITHPAIRQEIMSALARAKSPYVILSVPLLLEKKDESEPLVALCRRILVVDTSQEVQWQRACLRDKQSPKQIQAIMDKQLGRLERLALADDVVDNSGTLDELCCQLEKLHKDYLTLAQAYHQT